MILKREYLIIKGTKLERTEGRDGLAPPVRLVIISPKLAYDLYNEFRTNGDSDLLPSAVKLDNLVYNGYN